MLQSVLLFSNIACVTCQSSAQKASCALDLFVSTSYGHPRPQTSSKSSTLKSRGRAVQPGQELASRGPLTHVTVHPFLSSRNMSCSLRLSAKPCEALPSLGPHLGYSSHTDSFPFGKLARERTHSHTQRGPRTAFPRHCKHYQLKGGFHLK